MPDTEKTVKVLWSDGCVDEMTVARVKELRCYRNLGKHIVHIDSSLDSKCPDVEPNDSDEQERHYLTMGCWR